jgi:hypothetical protein
MMNSALLISAAACVTLAASNALPVVEVPLTIQYGGNHRVSTYVLPSYTDTPIEATYDLGSTAFWLFGPGAIRNWGKDCFGCEGPCNDSVPVDWTYDASKSSTASPGIPYNAEYGYGGGLNKLYITHESFNDTFEFVNSAGHSLVLPNTQISIADYLIQRQLDKSGNCTSDPPLYTRAIIGVGPYDDHPYASAGPQFRHNLLLQGRISNNMQSMWFDQAPKDLYGNITGFGLLGGIDTSKFEGPLVKVPSDGLNAYVPDTSFNGVTIPVDKSAPENLCFIDSGAFGDGIRAVNQGAFFNVTGIRQNPKRTQPGSNLAWPGRCETIRAHASFEYSFPGINSNETARIKVPLRSYVMAQDPLDEEIGWCTLNLYVGGCGFGTPFLKHTFFARDDDNSVLALAQGGVSVPGSTVDSNSILARIP